MKQVGSIDVQTVSRRTLLALATSAGFPIISGCNTSSNRSHNEIVSTTADDSISNELKEIRKDLEKIYRELDRFPISENGEFKFDVQGFEENFDYNNLLQETETLQERIIKIESESDIDLDPLSSVTTIAELLIRERIFTHQTIAAGLTYGKRLMQGEYVEATETARHGSEFLKKLSRTRRDIEYEFGEISGDIKSIDNFEPNSIQYSQLVVFELVQWTALIYRSFEYASTGFELFEDGSEKINEERIDEARQIFAKAGDRFTQANELQERAHGRGQRLEYVVPLVRKLRCVLPVYRDTCDSFVNSFTAWQSGDEDEARKIGRKVINQVDQRMAQCEESGSI